MMFRSDQPWREGEDKDMPATSALAWRFSGPVIGAVVMGLAALLWDGLRDKITEGKADAVAVELIKTENDAAHSKLNQKLDKVDARTKRDSRVTRAIARKLKIEVPEPEPKEE
jgi:hypothetical protein